MVKVIISGCNGKMGQVVTKMCEASPNIEIVAGVDINPTRQNGYPVFTAVADYQGEADCIIDFSHPNALAPLLAFCKERNCAIVIATTGHSADQLAAISEAAKEIRIFKSANMSLGINVLLELVQQAAKVLNTGYDVEIVEKHHNRKLDAPSGTAIMIADAAAAGLNRETEYVYERHSVRQPRGVQEIGISSVRGGTIVGEHDIIFAGTDEVLEITHTAYSRDIFANGAVKAAEYMAGVTAPGIYNMKDLVSEVI